MTQPYPIDRFFELLTTLRCHRCGVSTCKKIEVTNSSYADAAMIMKKRHLSWDMGNLKLNALCKIEETGSPWRICIWDVSEETALCSHVCVTFGFQVFKKARVFERIFSECGCPFLGLLKDVFVNTGKLLHKMTCEVRLPGIDVTN